MSSGALQNGRPVPGDCYLKGTAGDAANALLTAVGHNLRLVLAWLRILLCLILAALRSAISCLILKQRSQKRLRRNMPFLSRSFSAYLMQL